MEPKPIYALILGIVLMNSYIQIFQQQQLWPQCPFQIY